MNCLCGKFVPFSMFHNRTVFLEQHLFNEHFNSNQEDYCDFKNRVVSVVRYPNYSESYLDSINMVKRICGYGWLDITTIPEWYIRAKEVEKILSDAEPLDLDR